MEDEYLERVLSGETNAFRYFIETYKDMAFTLAASIVSDDQYAEEIVQDAFMKAFNGLKSFNRKASFKTWFYRIIVNESFQAVRKLKRRAETSDISAMEESGFDMSPPETGERMEEVIRAMQSLSPNERLVLNLHYLESFSLKEIEKVTGWSHSNTKVTLHRARKNLRNYFDSQPKNK